MAETEAERETRPTLRLVRPIVLIGLMGAGKSSVGLRLADTLRAPFRDSDAEIERAANLSVPEIFAKWGEPEFRDGERKVIARLLAGKPLVLATGGGAFMSAATRGVIARHAVSVWLKADLDLLVSRTAGRSHRPLLNRGDPREVLGRLIEERHPVYAKADVTVVSHAGQAHENMVTRIIAALKKHARATRKGAVEWE